MNKIQLIKYGSKEVIFEGLFNTIKDCVEAAIRENICLNAVNLQGVNLSNAELDGGSFQMARFDNANLSGANLSDADLEEAVFNNAVLHNTCFCESNLRRVHFFGATFGSTDIVWANLAGACFDTLSALDLKFSEALSQQSSMFYDRTGMACTMSRPPIVIKGLKYNIVLFDEFMKVGSAVLPYTTWRDIKFRPSHGTMTTDIEIFVKTYLDLLLSLVNIRGYASALKSA